MNLSLIYASDGEDFICMVQQADEPDYLLKLWEYLGITQTHFLYPKIYAKIIVTFLILDSYLGERRDENGF